MTDAPRRPRTARTTAYEQRDLAVRGLRMRYVDVRPEREEDVPVLLVHGHASRLEEYDELVPHLARRRRVLVPDLPGCGYSDKPDAPYDLALLEDHLLGFLDGLGVTRAHVAGGSLGGHLVLRLAAREPERFARIAAWAPAGAWDPMHGWALVGRVMKRLGPMWWLAMWVQSRFWYSRAWPGRDAALADAFRYYREVYGPGFRRQYWEVGIDQALSTLFARAHEIAHPTYLAVGGRDTALGMDRGVRRLAGVLPRATLRVFPDARHSLANELPAELGADVDAFLGGADD